MCTIFAYEFRCMAKVKTVYRSDTTNTFYDKSTGEVTSSETDRKEHNIVTANKDSFALIYSSVMGAMKGLNGNDIFVLTYCSLRAEYSTNRISITKPICEDITKEFDIPYQSIRNSVSKLAKKGILSPLGSATYMVNPDYYWRGNSSDRITKMREFVLRITIDPKVKPNTEFDNEK